MGASRSPRMVSSSGPRRRRSTLPTESLSRAKRVSSGSARSCGPAFLVSTLPTVKLWTNAVQTTPAPLIRYYWHLTSEAAVPFIAAATERLNANEVPFCLKVLADPHAFGRADAGLIFLRGATTRARAAIAHIHAAVESGLRESVPLFTKPIARGLGAAECPSGPVSFGDHRCNLAARALWRSFLRGDRDRAARAATFAAVYRAEGLDPRFPYLHAGSIDHFQLPIACEATARPMTLSDAGVRASPCTISPRDAAFRIGESLCRQAVWDSTGRHCNWIGRVRIGESEHASPTGVVAAALGPSLREGSAGIALFLRIFTL